MATYISNNCANISFYFTENREYNHPFIGCLFVNDLQYVKFCKHFSYYSSITPVFGFPNENSTWAKQNGQVWFRHEEITPPYPVMYLEDIEIHWIHESDVETLSEKYKRRMGRLDLKSLIIFMLSDADLCNTHSLDARLDIIKNFISIPTSLYLTRYEKDITINGRIFFIERWENAPEGRNPAHSPFIHSIGDRIDDYKFNIYKSNWFKLNTRKMEILNREVSIPSLLNKHYLNDCFGDYTLSILVCSSYECEITVRRHDDSIGWGFLIVTIESVNGEEKEIIDIGPSMISYKCINAVTKTNLVPVTYTTSLIPKKIIQSANSSLCEDIFVYNSFMSVSDFNPEYEYHFFNEKSRRVFIKYNFSNNTLLAYDLLVQTPYQILFFAYCYLYIFGGCYVDNKSIERSPIREVIRENKYVLCFNSTGNLVPYFICTVAKSKWMHDIINLCTNEILSNSYLPDFTDSIFSKIKESLSNDSKCFVRTQEKSYIYNTLGLVMFTLTPEIRESTNLFFTNYQDMGDWIIFVYPHEYNDVFSFRLQEDCLKIIRSYNEGWWLDLKLKIINDSTSDIITANVGRHHCGVKEIILDGVFKRDFPGNVFHSSSVNSDDLQITSEIVIIVPSVIYVSTNPLYGEQSRSLISPENRYLQTIDQLKSIRDKIPSCQIIVQEASICLTSQEIVELSNLCDYLILYTDDESFFYVHQNFLNKGLGELYMVHNICSLLQSKQFNHLCKFGGRYKCSNSFNLNDFTRYYPVASGIPGNSKLGILAQTVFYSIPQSFLQLYTLFLKAWLSPDTSEPIEHIFTMFLDSLPKVMIINTLGVEGYGATTLAYNLF
jgi:uncharacterized protein (DUF1919 family)